MPPPPKKPTKMTAIKSVIVQKRPPYGFALDTLPHATSSSSSSSDSESESPTSKKAPLKKEMPKKFKKSMQKKTLLEKESKATSSGDRRKATNPARLRQGGDATNSSTAAERRRWERDECPDIPRAAFQRLAREILLNENAELRYQRAAVEALQMASEAFIVRMMENTNLLAIHARRKTIVPSDLKLAIRLANR